MDRDTIARAQRTLAARGYEPGPADGIVGTRTRKAVYAFQRAQGLPATGHLTPATIAALDAPAPRPRRSSGRRRLIGAVVAAALAFAAAFGGAGGAIEGEAIADLIEALLPDTGA